MAPALVVLSPQSIVAVKSVGLAAELLSVKVATVSVKATPATAAMLNPPVAVITVAYAGADIVNKSTAQAVKNKRWSIDPPTYGTYHPTHAGYHQP
jgi:hypothetical protein